MEKNRKIMLIIISITVIVISIIIMGILVNSIVNKKKLESTNTKKFYTSIEISVINNKFNKYEGITKGAVIKSLINDVINYNKSEGIEYGKAIILEGGKGIENTQIEGIEIIDIQSINNKKKYIVNIKEYYDNGLIKKIYIEEVEEDNNNL